MSLAGAVQSLEDINVLAKAMTNALASGFDALLYGLAHSRIAAVDTAAASSKINSLDEQLVP